MSECVCVQVCLVEGEPFFSNLTYNVVSFPHVFGYTIQKSIIKSKRSLLNYKYIAIES